MAHHPSDSDILTTFREPSSREKGFTLLVRKYQEQIYWHLRRILTDHDDANDVVQNVFIKIWNNLDGFKENSKLYTWIYRIATNEAITFIKNKKANLIVPLGDENDDNSFNLQSDVYFKGTDIELKLQNAIKQLPGRQKMVFNMRYFGHMNYHDMAETLHVSIGTLKASYHIAVKKIEEFLKTN